MAVAKAHAIAAQIWSDFQQGTFDRSLMAYQPLISGKEVGLLEAVKARAEEKRQAAAIHAYRVLKRYGKPIRNRSDAEAFLGWLRAEGLSDCTIVGLMTHYRQCSGGNRHLFSHKLKWQQRSVQSACEFQAVLVYLESNDPWYYPLFVLWLSNGLRDGEIRGLTWDFIGWEVGELLVCKGLRRDSSSSGHHSWASTKTGRAGCAPNRLGVEAVQGADGAAGYLQPLCAGVCYSHQLFQHLCPSRGTCVEAFTAALWFESPLSLCPTP